MSFEQDEEDQFGQSYEDNKEFEFNGSGFGDEEINPHSPLDDSDKPRIILMGLRRSGKSSIEKVVFQKMSPNETLFLESTNKIVKQEVANSSFVQFQIWDFPGQIDLFDESIEYTQIFGGCGALIFVIDAQDDYMEALNKLNTTVVKAYKINSSIKFIVFIHKVDGLNEDTKMETQRDIHQRATDDLRDAFGNVPGFDKIHLSFHLTSIYDHSIFEAFSKVVQKLIPQLATLENLLNIIISVLELWSLNSLTVQLKYWLGWVTVRLAATASKEWCLLLKEVMRSTTLERPGQSMNSGIEKAFLFDVISKIYVATDCSPVDMQSYELCCDMIDVVIDIAGIYGSEESESGAFDENTSSLIKLNNGTVLYLREVNKFLALVCILREDNFDKQGVIDYNFLCFRDAIQKLFAMKKEEFLENGPRESNS